MNWRRSWFSQLARIQVIDMLAEKTTQGETPPPPHWNNIVQVQLTKDVARHDIKTWVIVGTQAVSLNLVLQAFCTCAHSSMRNSHSQHRAPSGQASAGGGWGPCTGHPSLTTCSQTLRTKDINSANCKYLDCRIKLESLEGSCANIRRNSKLTRPE